MAEEHATIGFVSGHWTKDKQVLREIDESEVINVHQFEGPVAKVKRGYGLTVSLAKKFEFARVDVSIELPCHVEEIDTADEFAKKWCEDRIREEVANIRNPSKGNGGKQQF